ncbi:MAG: TrkA family potassium uptake protein [Alphaproteobacteria bacterium]|nr:TrkA family potassium uptake protein [Alphaproteobacteria bacterium]MCB9695830.1 TrkA family potassium uptake protein [Alphaproteobacteria bacterium]
MNETQQSQEHKTVEQALVIGLGQYGMALARALVAHGVKVVAVDRRPDRVHLASEFVTEAVRADAQDEEQLAKLAPARRDLCVVAIGDDATEASILVTALLRQMGAPRVVARATNELHQRILNLVGAHEVVNPEASFGAQLAARLAHRGLIGELQLGDDLVVTELRTPDSFVGRSLMELELPRRFGVTVVVIRRTLPGSEAVSYPTAYETVEQGDVLVCVSPPGAVHELVRRM